MPPHISTGLDESYCSVPGSEQEQTFATWQNEPNSASTLHRRPNTLCIPHRNLTKRTQFAPNPSNCQCLVLADLRLGTSRRTAPATDATPSSSQPDPILLFVEVIKNARSLRPVRAFGQLRILTRLVPSCIRNRQDRGTTSAPRLNPQRAKLLRHPRERCRTNHSYRKSCIGNVGSTF
jgi:hypothetical protein